MKAPKSSTATSNSLTSLPARLKKIAETLRREYCRKHSHPWIVAYSGGKDSTLLLQMIWETVAGLPTDQRQRSILIVSNDTLVESPLVIRHLRESLKVIGDAATAQELPVDIRVTTPAIDQTFWVSVIGRGYIPPTRNFRWCTDRMKIRPTSRLLQDIVREHGGAILLVGTRRSESQNRRRGMDRRKVSAGKTNQHDSVEGCRMFSPLADLDDDDVWMVLMQRRPPWGGTHRQLITLYRQAGGGECPLVMTEDDAPSCGSSSPRFGCWTCTVVKKDRSLRGLIDSGHEEAAKMESMFDFREWLVTLREDDNNRLPVRRDGNPRNRTDGTRVFGPFTLTVRRTILDRLIALEKTVGGTLITPAEIECIEDVWWRDEIAENGRLALLDSVSTS